MSDPPPLQCSGCASDAQQCAGGAQECADDAKTNGIDNVHPRRCRGFTRVGRPCRMFALTGDDFCINHFDGADTVEAARHAATIRHISSAELINTAFSFTDRASIQAVIDSTFRLILSGRLSQDRAALALRACAIAVRNFDRSRDTISGPVPQQHDWFLYFEKVRGLLASVDPILALAIPGADEDFDTADEAAIPPSNAFIDPHANSLALTPSEDIP